LRSRALRREVSDRLSVSPWLLTLSNYPADERLIAPTILGNQFRVLETYAFDRFRIDSGTLWGELVAHTGESVRVDLERAAAEVDFCVCALYLSLLLGILTLVTSVTQSDHHVRLLIIGGISVLSAPVWYWLAVVNIPQWQAAAQAVVNVGRVPLATALGLRLPSTLGEERKMWSQVDLLIGSPYSSALGLGIDPFRLGRRAASVDDKATAPEDNGDAEEADELKVEDQLGEDGCSRDPP
jgi:hypothetical protein